MARLYTYYSGSGTNTPISEFDYRWFMDYTSTQNSSGNYSDIECKLYINFVQVREASMSTIWLTTIDGTTTSGTVNTPSNCPTSYLLHTSTKRVYHNSDGNKSIYVQGAGQRGDQLSPMRYTNNTLYVLPTIPRYANITSFGTNNVALTSFNYYVTADAALDYAQHSLNGGAWVDSGNQVISGLTPGTQYSLRCRVRRADNGLWTESGTIYVTTLYNPTNITVFTTNPNPIKEKGTVTLGWSGATTAQGTIDYYHIYSRHYNGSTWTDYLYLQQVAGTSTTHTPITNYPTIKSGDVIQYKVFTHNTSGGWSSGIECQPTLGIILNSSCDIKVAGTYKGGKPWIKISGIWKKGTLWTKVGGTWKTGI